MEGIPHPVSETIIFINSSSSVAVYYYTKISIYPFSVNFKELLTKFKSIYYNLILSLYTYILSTFLSSTFIVHFRWIFLNIAYSNSNYIISNIADFISNYSGAILN